MGKPFKLLHGLQGFDIMALTRSDMKVWGPELHFSVNKDIMFMTDATSDSSLED